MNYALSPWEAIDLIREILLKYHSGEGNTDVVSGLNIRNDLENLLYYSREERSKMIPEKLLSTIKLEPEYKFLNTKAGSGKHHSLIYEISLNVKKGYTTYLSDKDLTVLLTCVGRPDSKNNYTRRRDFEPKYEFREKFNGTNWILYTWDYDIKADGTLAPGIRRSILRFTNIYRVTLEVFRVRDQEALVYSGTYEPERFDYLKIRFKSSKSHTPNEEDLSMIFFAGGGAISLAVGTYRSIDCGALLSGSAIIMHCDQDAAIPKADFLEGFALSEVDPLITQYLSDKTLNYSKLPNGITSLNKLANWTIKKRKGH